MSDHEPAGHRAPSVVRTTIDDDLFIRMDVAMGLPVINQIVWRLTRMPGDDDVEQFARRLGVGRLGRALRRSHLPLVRDHWIASPNAGRVRDTEEWPLADDAVIPWANAAIGASFDLAAGPVWELRRGHLASGGAVVSLCSAHAAGDGAMVVAAVADAFAGVDADFRPGTPSAADQVRDAVGQAATIAGSVGGIVRTVAPHAWRTMLPDALTRRVGPAGSPQGSDEASSPVVTAPTSRVLPIRTTKGVPEQTSGPAPMCVVTTPADAWADVAARAGGSSNTLFIAIVVGVLAESGRVGPDDTVRIAVPMSQRGADDDRANATIGVSLDIPVAAVESGDLATVHRLARAAYAASDGPPSMFVRLQPVIQALGDRAVAALTRSATTPLALASNLGTIDAAFAGFGDPERAGALVTRSTTQSVSADRLRRLRGALAAWVNTSAGNTTISVAGLDPDALHATALSAIVRRQLERWSVDAWEW